MRTYLGLILLPTFEERFEYLKLGGKVGEETFGLDRHLNQVLYHSAEWKRVRDIVIARDEGCDLAMPGREIFGRVLIHHMNPITRADIINRSDLLLDPEYLICVSKRTHDAIHYGDRDLLYSDPVVRTPNDTCPWKHSK